MGRFAAQNFLPRERRYIQFIPRQRHRKSSRCGVAQGKTSAVRRDRMAVRHTNTGRSAVPRKADIIIIIQRGHVHDFAVLGGVNGVFDFQLFDCVSNPTRAKAFPRNHLSRTLTKQ